MGQHPREPKYRLSFALALSILLLPVAGLAQCFIGGFCFAELNQDEPELGAWKYTLGVSWTTDGAYGDGQLNLSFGWEDHDCICPDFADAFAFADSAGFSNGEDHGDPCFITWEADFHCHGYQNMPEFREPLISFEPEEGLCQPGEDGNGLFSFYCDWPPRELSLPNDYLSYHTAGLFCFGELTGVLPRLDCGPVPVLEKSWSEIKSDYSD
jgi:hypothetical protein